MRWTLAIAAAVPALAASGIAIRTEDLPRAIRGVSFAAPIQLSMSGRCPIDDVHFTLASGRLPSGLGFNLSGISGIPRELGFFRFVVRAENSCTSAAREFQILVTAKPILEVSPETVEMAVTAGDGAHQRTTVLVSASWPGFPYSVSEPREHWLTLLPAEGITPSEGSALRGDRLILDVDPSKLEPGLYRQTITVSGWQAASVARIEVVVRATPK